MKTGKVWVWLIPLTLFWPIMQSMVSLIRFGHLPLAGLSFSLVFLPMSLVSGIVFLLLWTRFVKHPQSIGILLGYALASPIALIGSLLSGLVYQPIAGTLRWGAVPLVIGMGIFLGLLFFAILLIALRAQHRPIQTGSESLVGKTGTAKTHVGGAEAGQVQVGSELWSAEKFDGAESGLDGPRKGARDYHHLCSHHLFLERSPD